MDRVIEKTKTQRLIKHWPYVAGGIVILIIIAWLVFGNHASTLRVDKDELTISEVKSAEFKDYVRTNGQVLPIQVVQISPEEGGIVMEKVVEEGSHVKKGDVIVRLSNSNLDLQILNAEAELAEKQNLLRNPSEQPDGAGSTRYGHPAQAAHIRAEQATLSGEAHQQGGLPAVAGGLPALCQEAFARFEAPEARLHLSLSADGPDGGQPPEHAQERGAGSSA